MAHLSDAQSPASKKSGSTLKKSKDSAEDKSSADVQQESKSTDEVNESDKKDKKKRKKSASEDAAPETNGEMKKKKRRHAEDDKDESRKKKKRVSFGPGTKEHDADSDSGSDNADDNDATATDGAEADTEDIVDKELEETKKLKREKKKKQKKDGTASTGTPVHETPILSYLSHYHRARATWKFQKNRETNLFKHLYSLEQVPSRYNTSLLAYMQGLKGDAAKQRMSDAARDVIKADMELDKPKDDEAENQEPTAPEYREAVDAFRECLPKGDEDLDKVDFGEKLEGDVKKRLPKRQRAELVFFAVAGKLFSVEDLKTKSKPKASEPAVPKKRKNRTVVVDISSSEESGDDAPAKKTVGKSAPETSDDETSSSGSSSDSDSDSSSDDVATPAKAKATAASTPSSSGPGGVTMSNKEKKAAQKKQKFVPVREAKAKPDVPKKIQKRKLRTAQIEISSSESDSE
jgi:hypothetical protein